PFTGRGTRSRARACAARRSTSSRACTSSRKNWARGGGSPAAAPRSSARPGARTRRGPRSRAWTAGQRSARRSRELPPRREAPLLRKTAAVWAGKATGALSRITRRGGGTTLPGDVARAIDPKILTRLAHDLTQGSVVITGTNGKTTTARLVSWLLEGAGHRVVSNRSGANLIFGATAAALNRADANGTLKADWGVFEIDEASLPRAVDEIQPRSTLVLNLFRDQLDR